MFQPNLLQFHLAMLVVTNLFSPILSPSPLEFGNLFKKPEIVEDLARTSSSSSSSSLFSLQSLGQGPEHVPIDPMTRQAIVSAEAGGRLDSFPHVAYPLPLPPRLRDSKSVIDGWRSKEEKGKGLLIESQEGQGGRTQPFGSSNFQDEFGGYSTTTTTTSSSSPLSSPPRHWLPYPPASPPHDSGSAASSSRWSGGLDHEEGGFHSGTESPRSESFSSTPPTPPTPPPEGFHSPTSSVASSVGSHSPPTSIVETSWKSSPRLRNYLSNIRKAISNLKQKFYSFFVKRPSEQRSDTTLDEFQLTERPRISNLDTIPEDPEGEAAALEGKIPPPRGRDSGSELHRLTGPSILADSSLARAPTWRKGQDFQLPPDLRHQDPLNEVGSYRALETGESSVATSGWNRAEGGVEGPLRQTGGRNVRWADVEGKGPLTTSHGGSETHSPVESPTTSQRWNHEQGMGDGLESLTRGDGETGNSMHQVGSGPVEDDLVSRVDQNPLKVKRPSRWRLDFFRKGGRRLPIQPSVEEPAGLGESSAKEAGSLPSHQGMQIEPLELHPLPLPPNLGQERIPDSMLDASKGRSELSIHHSEAPPSAVDKPSLQGSSSAEVGRSLPEKAFPLPSPFEKDGGALKLDPEHLRELKSQEAKEYLLNRLKGWDGRMRFQRISKTEAFLQSLRRRLKMDQS